MDSEVAQKVIVRAPSLKRGRNDESEQFHLEHVMGVTVGSNAALCTDCNSHLVAYPSGCTIVLYNSSTGQQQSYIVNQCRKTITALAFSSDGKYLVSGECGHMPFVRIWELATGQQIAEFQGHQYGINCVAFSPSNKYIVSIGSQHDMIVNVWDWRSHIKIASNKVSTKIKGLCFAEDGSYFVTVGNRHVKFWYLEYTRNTKYKEAVPLLGRAAILGTQRNQNFVSVACGKGECADSTYVVTKSGLLCQLNQRRLLDKWLELRTTSATSMTVGDKYIFVGCAEGIVRCFDPVTLNFITTLPRTHHLGVDVSQCTSIGHMSIHPANAKYPDTIAIVYDQFNHKLISIYNDHSIFVWDVRQVKRVGKFQSFLYHSACIWGIEMVPTRQEISQFRQLSPEDDAHLLPDGCFITCSSDDTIRIWRNTNGIVSGVEDALTNIYSNELLKIIYMDPDLTYLKDQDLTAAALNNGQTADGAQTQPPPAAVASYDGKNGVRCIRIRPDAIHLASGDRAGNIAIHDMRTMKEVFKIEAHDAEVLCLEYSKVRNGISPRLLASASRDRLIHVFNVDDGYNILQTLDDHSSSITAVRFIALGNEQLKMISCGADKSIIFRTLTNGVVFQRDHNVAGRTTLYDMEVDSMARHILTACQDRNVRFYSSRSGHYVRSMRGSPSDDGSLIKVALNHSGRFMATSCTDKTLAVYCIQSGQLLACVAGHSELATGLKFTKSGDCLVSAGGDASVLMWRYRKKPAVSTINTESTEYDSNANLEPVEYQFTDSPLPLWAKKHTTESTTSITTSSNIDLQLPRGRWAQRVEQSISMRSVYDTDSVIQLPVESDGSKDSSIDSGTEYIKESRIKLNRIRHTAPHTDDSSLGSMLGGGGGGSSALGGDDDDSTAEHDGDVEDCYETEQVTKIASTVKLQFPEMALDSPSEYTVNAISVDELRKSQRKSKTKRNDLPLISISTSVSTGSQESDIDDDDASTPSGGDTTDKNPISLLSGSTESLDQLANRAKYLQSAFDSLTVGGGAGVEHSENGNDGKRTLSSLHHRTSSGIQPRNIPLINEAKQTKYENETVRKREELNRRIEETRLKLQSVGYKSNLKSSQSVLDLSPIPEKQKPSQSPIKRNTILHPDFHSIEDEGGLRRACSLSDLTATMSPGKVINNSESETESVGSGQMGPPSSTNHRLSSRFSTSNLMRPTISSKNKMAAPLPPSLSSSTSINKTNLRRRAMQLSYSTANLTTIGRDDSSSDEHQKASGNGGSKRNRSHSIDQSAQRIRNKENILNKNRSARNALSDRTNSEISSSMSRGGDISLLNNSNVDLTNSELTSRICNEIGLQLTQAANNVVNLYKRLNTTTTSTTDNNTSVAVTSAAVNDDMMKHLERAITETKSILEGIGGTAATIPKTTNTSTDINLRDLITLSTQSTSSTAAAATTTTPSPPGDMVYLMQQYSDILLNMMQQKMQNNNNAQTK